MHSDQGSLNQRVPIWQKWAKTAPRASGLAFLSDLGRLLTISSATSESLELALNMMTSHLGVASCALSRLDQGTEVVRGASRLASAPSRLVLYASSTGASPPPSPQASIRYDLTHLPWHQQAIETAQTAILRDGRLMEEKERAFLRWEEVSSACFVPLNAGARVLGVLAVCEERPRSRDLFTSDWLSLLEAAAVQLAGALARLELEDRVLHRSAQVRSRQLQSFAKVSSNIAAVVDADELARFATEQICRHFDYDGITLFVKVLESGEVTRWVGDRAAPPEECVTSEKVSLDTNDWIGRAMSSGKTRATIQTVQGDEGPVQERVLVAVPLRVSGQVLGALQVTARSGTTIDALDLSTLELLAGQIAAGLASARAHQVIREHATSLETLQGVSREMTASLEAEEVYEAIYRGTVKLMDGDAFFIALCDKTNERGEYVFQVDNGKRLAPFRFELGKTLVGYLVRTGTPALFGDLVHETRFETRHWGGEQVPQSAIGVPLLIGAQVVGALSAQSYRPRAYDISDLQILATLASQAAVAINNAHLYAERQRKMEELSVLNEVGRIVSSTIEIDRLLELIYDQVRRILRADSYYVALLDESEQELTVEILVDEGKRFPRMVVPAGAGLASRVVQSRSPLLIRNVYEETARLKIQPFILGESRVSESWLGVPMITSEHLVGVLAVSSYSPDSFNEGDLEILQNVATQAAIAVDNARHHALVEEQARKDSLTEALNHGFFLTRLHQEVKRAADSMRRLSLIMLDIDHFKDYNDRYGHLAGDAVLKGTVQAIRDNIKHTDLVGRWGGEEFAIALPGSDSTGALGVAERIRQTLAEMVMTNDQGRPVPVPTVSQGIAVFPEDAEEAIALVDVADQRLYAAKARGRDQIGC